MLWPCSSLGCGRVEATEQIGSDWQEIPIEILIDWQEPSPSGDLPGDTGETCPTWWEIPWVRFSYYWPSCPAKPKRKVVRIAQSWGFSSCTGRRSFVDCCGVTFLQYDTAHDSISLRCLCRQWCEFFIITGQFTACSVEGSVAHVCGWATSEQAVDWPVKTDALLRIWRP